MGLVLGRGRLDERGKEILVEYVWGWKVEQLPLAGEERSEDVLRWVSRACRDDGKADCLGISSGLVVRVQGLVQDSRYLGNVV